MTREEEYLQRRMEEAVQLCTEFLLTNSSDIDLASKTGISSSTVGRRLTNKELIEQAYPEIKRNLLELGYNENLIPENGAELFEFIAKKRQENLKQGKMLGSQATYFNHVYKNNDQRVNKLSLGIFYSDIEKQYKFLVNAALYFKLHLKTLSELFQIDEKEIYNNILRYCPNLIDSVNVLFNHDGKDQTIACNNFLDYYHSLLNAARNKDLEERKRLVALIGDSKAVELKKRRNPGDKFTEEDLETLIRYQLKYALTATDLAYIFEINRSTFQKNVKKFLEGREELKKEYEYLMDYNNLKRDNLIGVRRG